MMADTAKTYSTLWVFLMLPTVVVLAGTCCKRAREQDVVSMTYEENLWNSTCVCAEALPSKIKRKEKGKDYAGSVHPA